MLFDINGRPAGDPSWNKDHVLKQKLTSDEQARIIDTIVAMSEDFIARDRVISGPDGKTLMVSMLLNDIHPFRNHVVFRPLEDRIGGEAAIGILGVLLWEALRRSPRNWTCYDQQTIDHRQMQYFLL